MARQGRFRHTLPHLCSQRADSPLAHCFLLACPLFRSGSSDCHFEPRRSVDATNRSEFHGAVDELRHARRRDGAYASGLYEDVADVGWFLETFSIESWLELMHQREGVTHADELLLDRIRHLLAETPRVTPRVLSERPPTLEEAQRRFNFPIEPKSSIVWNGPN